MVDIIKPPFEEVSDYGEYDDSEEDALTAGEDAYDTSNDYEERIRVVESLVLEYFRIYPHEIFLTEEEALKVQLGMHPTPGAFGQFLMDKYFTPEAMVSTLQMNINSIVAVFWRVAAEQKLVASPEIEDEPKTLRDFPPATLGRCRTGIANKFVSMRKAGDAPIQISTVDFTRVSSGDFTVELPPILNMLLQTTARKLAGHIDFARQLIWEEGIGRGDLRTDTVSYIAPEVPQPARPRMAVSRDPHNEVAAISNMISYAIQGWAKRSKVFPKNLVIDLTEADFENWQQGNYNVMPIPTYIDPKLEEAIMHRRELSAEVVRSYFWARIKKLDLQVRLQPSYDLES